MGRMSLPPGFRFHPTDNELIMFYLKRKVAGKKLHYDAITELDIYMFCPWDLPDKCLLKSKDLEWYFFSPSKKKYGRGARTNRATENGYWKATGKDRPVIYKQRTVGMIKTLIFHTGHAPKGERTDWVMHEYRLEDESIADVVQDSYRLCKIFQKSGLGPQIGAHYGAPFNEEEWSDAEEICVESFLVASQILPDCVLPSNKTSSDEVTLNIPGNSPQRSTSEPDQSTDRPLDINMNTDTEKINVEPLSIDAQVLYNYVPPIDVGSSAAMNMTVLGNSSGWRASKSGPSTAGPPVMDIPCSSDLPYEDFDALLDMFIEDSYMPTNNCDEKFENNGSLPCLDENGIYNGLGDLNDWVVPKETGFNVSSTPDAAFHLNAMLLSEDIPFLELDDLETPLRCPAETGEFNTSQTQDAAYNLNPVLLCDDTPYLELDDLNTPFGCPAETGQCERTHTDSIYAAHTHDRSMGINGSYSDNLSSLVNVSEWSGPSVLLQGSDMLGNNLDDLGRDNCISNFEAHDYDVATCIEVPFSRREPEGSSTADQIQRRGEWHTNLQLLLESVSAQLAELLAHMIRAKQLNDSFPHIGSSIHFKAEVTLKFCECTKDALLHNMEESPSVFLCWDYLPTREIKNRMPASSFVFSYNLAMVWILMTKYHIFFDLSCSVECANCLFWLII